jgi:5'-phosphate synthase pdxT subunit
MFMMLDRLGMREPLAELLEEDLPVFGTCAGAILMASEVVDGRADQWCFSAVDIVIRRNGYGRQIQSFEADLVAAGLDEPFHAPFIRAPVIESSGPQVEVLAQLDEHPVLVRQGTRVLSTFHPELTPDTRIHRLWLDTWG